MNPSLAARLALPAGAPAPIAPAAALRLARARAVYSARLAQGRASRGAVGAFGPAWGAAFERYVRALQGARLDTWTVPMS